jgi:hypothetical protein
LNEQRAFEQGTPPIHDIVIAKTFYLVRTKLEHEVIVIAHHRVGANVDCKERGEKSNSVYDPLAAVFVALARVVIHPAQISTAHATRGDVVIRRVRQ